MPLSVSRHHTLPASTYNAGSNGTLRALESLLTEVARARIYGFHPKEIDRALRHFKSEVGDLNSKGREVGGSTASTPRR